MLLWLRYMASTLGYVMFIRVWHLHVCVWSAAEKLWLQWSKHIPDSKVHGANMGPTWVLSAPDGPHVGPINLVIRDVMVCMYMYEHMDRRTVPHYNYDEWNFDITRHQGNISIFMMLYFVDKLLEALWCYFAIWNMVNSGSGNSLLPDAMKSSPEPVLTNCKLCT